MDWKRIKEIGKTIEAEYDESIGMTLLGAASMEEEEGVGRAFDDLDFLVSGLTPLLAELSRMLELDDSNVQAVTDSEGRTRYIR